VTFEKRQANDTKLWKNEKKFLEKRSKVFIFFFNKNEIKKQTNCNTHLFSKPPLQVFLPN